MATSKQVTVSSDMNPSQNERTPNQGTTVSALPDDLLQRLRTLEAASARHERLLADAQAATSEWERALDAIEDPICIVTTDYSLLYANAAYARLFGSEHDGHDRHYCFNASQAYAEGRPGPCDECPLPCAVHGRRPGFAQQEWRTADGLDEPASTRTYQRWTYPIVNADGGVDRVVEVLKDVSEQERMRHAIAQEDALREADRLKSELLGTVSHELRSPLTAIKGYAATLLRHERRLPPEERREFLHAITEASDRLEVIIDRLLEMSQLETGASAPQMEPVDVVRVAREAVAAAERTVSGDSTTTQTFETRILTEGVPATRSWTVIQADSRMLRAALDNLIENAVKYTPEGGRVTVTVGAAQTGPDGAPLRDMLEIVVRDTGVGIPAEQLSRVFERFHRVDTRLTREVDGMGLGLALCQRIAELHGGRTWAESVPNEGSAFHLALPMAPATERESAPITGR